MTTATAATDKELEVLETIHSASENGETMVQRDIAHVVGVSVGMTNAIMKRLVKKGLITIRKVNNRNIHYAVSPEGVRALSQKSYRYFRRTIKNVVYYKEKIGSILEEVRERGYERVVLAGRSDLDFIVEHFCFKYGLEFCRAKAEKADDVDTSGDANHCGSDGAGNSAQESSGDNAGSHNAHNVQHSQKESPYIFYSENIAPPEEENPCPKNVCYLRWVVV